MELIYSLLVVFISSCINDIDSRAEWTVKPYPFYNPSYGNALDMKCNVDTPFIGFYFKGQKLEDGPHYTITNRDLGGGNTEYTLKINKVDDDDFGSYYCNDTDAISTATLHIQASIPSLMTEQKLAVGDMGTVQAVVHGMPKNTITWEFSTDDGITYSKIAELNDKGVQVVGKNRYTVLRKGGLVIKEVKLDDAGTYQVSTRSISAGLITESTKVLAGNKPELKFVPPESYITTQGLDLKIHCEWVYDIGEPEWVFTDRNGQVTSLTSGFDAMALTLTNVTPLNEGNYTCKAENDYGNASTTAELTLVVIPPEITTEFMNESKAENSQYNLTCTATGTPLPTVTLSKSNGVDLKAGTGSVTYTFASLTLADKGDYSCRADNGAKEASGAALHTMKMKSIDILTIPMFNKVVTTKSVSSALGLDFSIQCSAKSNPAPTVELLKNNVKLSSTSETKDGFVIASLEVVTAVDDDFGDIICEATNSQGTNKTTIKVNRVVEAPAPTGLRQNQAAGFEYIDLIWDKVDTADSYTIYINGSMRNESSPDNSLTIRELQKNTYYRFAVASVNIAGIGSPSDPVIFQTSDIIKPEVVSGFNIVSKSSSEIQVSWSKPSNINDEAIIYEIKWCKATNDTTPKCHSKLTQDTRLELENLEPSTEYDVHITASNQGVASEKKSFTVESESAPTKPGVPSEKGDGGLGAAAVAGVIIAVILIILIVVDLFCCYFNHCGFSHCCFESLCASKNTKKYAPADTQDEELTEIKSKSDKTETV